MGTQPLWSNNRKAVQCCAHGFPHAQHSVECADLSQHVGGIGTLSSPCLQPAFLLKYAEHFLQQERLTHGFLSGVSEIRTAPRVRTRGRSDPDGQIIPNRSSQQRLPPLAV